jgi:hypothetical protein
MWIGIVYELRAKNSQVSYFGRQQTQKFIKVLLEQQFFKKNLADPTKICLEKFSPFFSGDRK